MSRFKKKKDEEDSIESLQAQIESLKKENSDQAMLMQDTIIQKDKELKEKKNEIKTLKEKMQSLPNQEDIEKYKKEIESLNDEKSSLIQQALKAKNEFRFLESEKEQLIQDKVNLGKEIDANKNKFIHLEEDKKALENEIKRLNDIIKRKEDEADTRKISDLASLVAEKDEAVKTSKDILMRYEKVKQEYKVLQEKYDREKEILEKKIMEIQRNLDEKNNIIQQTLDERRSLIKRNEEERKNLLEKNKAEKQTLLTKTIEEKNKAEELLRYSALDLDSEYNKSLADILSDYLVKTNSNKFSLSVFDLFQLIIINLNLFDEVYENSESIETASEIPLLLYSDIYKFLLENYSKIKEIKLNDYLQNTKLIMQSNYDKNIVELIKKVKIFNDKDSSIFDTYKKKKELFNKIAENNFDLIKKFIYDRLKAKEKESKEKINQFELANKFVNYNEKEKFILVDFRKSTANERMKEITATTLYLLKESIMKVENFRLYFNDGSTTDDLLFFIYFLKFYNNKIKSLSVGFEDFKSEKPLVKYFQQKLYIILGILSDLKELELVNINFLPEGQETLNLIKALTSSKIEKLSLISALTKHSSFYISEYLAKSKIIVELDCCQHKTPGLLAQFIPYLKGQPNLTTLNLACNVLNSDDLDKISDLMQSENKIKSIDLSNVKMTQEFCNTFGLGLRKIQTLETLKLSNCNITAETFNFLINRNTTNTLKTLVLDFNKIGDAGCNGLGSYVRGNPNIKYLSIKNCDFSLVGFSLFKVMVGVSALKDAEIHIEDNAHIENSDILNYFGKDSLLEDKGIKLFIRKREFNEKTVSALMAYREVMLV